ncbi:Oar protein [Shewanella colwelliana]|uniref:Oar protein n=1 Tax=Shewanella colwelliana TaxID=23 RepID=A0A1E5IS89_SHECO|nr:TonB-dependent receptor [Shewanella colwelliana]MDX1280166.1 TonB-dependent receptor [Shewanella colwelliana]OEG73421.1 TonB-dependent receptor [Shewanella colwelliana]GIU24128.1 Oar protein [Shewanella colwelliana]GIU44355.1 Oar protein [Shewanella colwelliana]
MSGSNARGRFTPRKTLAAIAVGSVLLMSAPAAMAVDGSSIVKGQVASSTGSNIANATITLKHKTKGLVYTVQTNDKGEYILRNVPVGKYDITISKDGFIQSEQNDVEVTIGQSIILDGQLATQGEDNIERIAVTGSMIRRVDMASSTSGVTFTQSDLQSMPVNTGFESIALLAPGTSAPGGSNFKGASSFGGASAAENGYYFNGMNVTSIRTGLGSIRLPWEAISQTQVQTGGVSPEFGGALGGIVNAVSKSGENEFSFGTEVRWDPSSTRSSHDSLFNSEGVIQTNTAQDSYDFKELQLWASGAIVEDKLFFYGLFAPRREDQDWAGSTVKTNREREEDRWFAKVDWFINSDHSFGLSAMNNKRTWTNTNYAYDWETNIVGEQEGVAAPGEDGGQMYSLNYNGYFSDDFSVSAVVGRTSENVENVVASTNPSVYDYRNGSYLSTHTNSSVSEEEYIRDQARIDFNWDLESHSIQFGVDYTKVTVDFSSGQNGVGDAEGWWSVKTAGVDDRSGAPVGTDFIERRIRTRYTDSEVTSLAFYANDSWQVTDQLVLNLGLRYSGFDNTVSDGREYVSIDNQIAPRLQAIYDVFGDGSAKVFATYGRYFQPVSANMNITQGSSSIEWFEYSELDQVDANGQPILEADGSPSRGAMLRDRYWRQRGITEPGLIASANLKPMYSDEFTVGYQQELFDTMSGGVRFVYRDLGRSVEDTDVGPVLAKKLQELGIDDNVGQGSYYVLNNPGEAIQMSYDFDGDGQVDDVTLSAEELMLPKAERKYLAMEFTLDGNVTDDLTINSSYTWSHSYGNTEGLVKTDNNQADPGWTTSYDYGDLMDHSNGDLPNDHRHSIKISGAYKITDDLIFGLVARTTSGRPQSMFSQHPDSVDSCAPGNPWEDCISRYYDQASHYDENGNPAPRGTAGNLPWVTNVDMSLMYKTELLGGGFSVKGTVYNVLNSDTATNINEERARYADTANGLELNPDYGMTTDRQTERYFSLVARYEF